MTSDEVLHVAPDGGPAQVFATGVVDPIGATFVPDEFGGKGNRLFVTTRDPSDKAEIIVVHQDGSTENFAILNRGNGASGLLYLPEDFGGPAAGHLLCTAQTDGRGSEIYLVDDEGTVREIIDSRDKILWVPAIAPRGFGENGGRVFVTDALGDGVYVLDLKKNTARQFSRIPLGDNYGLRQITFSPEGWAASLDPELADESVLLVAVASSNGGGPGGGSVVILDQRGRQIAVLDKTPNNLLFNPRGLNFIGDNLLISDIADDHGWLIRVTVDDFALTDCNENGVPDVCDIAEGTSKDFNENGIPDECEGLSCDLIRKFKAKCRKNKLKVTVKSSLAQGTRLTIDNNGKRRTMVIKRRGKGKTLWFNQTSVHVVQIVQCPDFVDAVNCGE